MTGGRQARTSALNWASSAIYLHLFLQENSTTAAEHSLEWQRYISELSLNCSLEPHVIAAAAAPMSLQLFPSVRKNTPRVARWVVRQGQAESPFSRHTLLSTGAFLVPITGQYNCQGSLRTDSLQ